MRNLTTKNAAMMAVLFAAGLLLLSAVPASAFGDPCGASVSGVLGTCQNADCVNYTANGRVFRGGGANLGTCESPGSCGNFGAQQQVYDAYYYTTSNPGECNCVEVVFNTGACGVSVHSTLFDGIVPAGPVWSCTGPDFAYIADEGSSLPLTYSGPISDTATGGSAVGDLTVLQHSNFGTGATGCTYSYSINCRSIETLGCVLGPIEAKLDALGGQ